MTRASLREYAARQRERYEQATRTQKRQLLDEIVTHMHRKAVIRLLRRAPRRAPPPSRAGRPRVYGAEIATAAEVLWQASGRIGAHRLHPFVPELLDRLLRCDELRLAPAVAKLVRQASRSTMATSGHLWAIGYDDMGRANQVREEIISLAWDKHYLFLNDLAVVVQHADGSYTLDRERLHPASNLLGCTTVGLLAGLVLGVPVVGAAIGAMVGGAGSAAVWASAGIGEDFVREVQGLMKPGTSAVFVLDSEGDMDVILHAIRGLGGTVLKTNVDLERARLIQSTLAAPAPPTSKSDTA